MNLKQALEAYQSLCKRKSRGEFEIHHIPLLLRVNSNTPQYTALLWNSLTMDIETILKRYEILKSLSTSK